jgi:hypothetical protein
MADRPAGEPDKLLAIRKRVVRCHPCDGELVTQKFFGFEVLVSEDWPADAIGVLLDDEQVARILMPGWRVITWHIVHLDCDGNAILGGPR